MYRDYGLFKYWFRSIEKNAPWVNKVYLVTEDHLPEWLNKDCLNNLVCSVIMFFNERYKTILIFKKGLPKNTSTF
nr:hypothetical protein [Latilactobacillus curvatus]